MLSEFDYHELALQAYDELTSRASPPRVVPGSAHPTLSDALARSAPLPPDALFLGMAVDGLPVLLHLDDPTPGALLIAATARAGKTMFLKAIVHAAGLHEQADNIRFCVLTPCPAEWEEIASSPQCLGIFDAQDDIAPEFLADLAIWGREQRRAGEWGLLLVDDLTLITSLPPEAHQTLRWLLVRGPGRGIWPLATLDVANAEQVLPWLAAFRTRLMGPVQKREQAEVLTGAEWNVRLEPGQFALREGHGWLKFWVPKLNTVGG